MLNQCRLQETTRLSCFARLLSFWSNYTALTLSQVICAAEGETLSKVSAEISTGEKRRNSPVAQKQCEAFIFPLGQGHPAENSSDDTHDNANVRGVQVNSVRMVQFLHCQWMVGLICLHILIIVVILYIMHCTLTTPPHYVNRKLNSTFPPNDLLFNLVV